MATKKLARRIYRTIRDRAYQKGLIPLTPPKFDNDLTVPCLLACFDRFNIDAIVDVGANSGQFAQLAKSKAGFKGPLHCFEPDRRQHAQLQLLAEKEGNMHLHDCALGRTSGEMEMNFFEISTLNSFSDLSGDLIRSRLEERRVVRIRTLDEVLAEIDADRLFLKIDTQGHDLEVLGGLNEHLDRVKAIMVEVAFQQIYQDAPLYDQTIKALQDLGFAPTAVPFSNLHHGVITDSDMIFTRLEKVPH